MSRIFVTLWLISFVLGQVGTAAVSSTSESSGYPIGAEERRLVEEVVMAESGAEPYIGQLAVAQCILDAAELEDLSPAQIVKKYGYTSKRKSPSDSVKKAVSAVFDDGERAKSERMLYFYAPAFGTSRWHEKQAFVAEIGNHRFFDMH